MERVRNGLGVLVFAAVIFATQATAQDLSDVALPAPRMEGGKPVMEALKGRQSSRGFDVRKLPDQVLSDLLWAGAGINRADSGKRTAPSARNWQEVEIYAVTEDGAYLYDAKANVLKAVLKGDIRKLTGTQEFVSAAPLTLVYVADTTKMTGASPEDLDLYVGVDTGFISENVYLFCASEGLATVVRGSVDRKALAEALKLPVHKRVTFAQTVGYPAATGE